MPMKSHAQYLKELKEIHGGDIIPVEEYKGCRKRIKHRCDVCGHIWCVTPQTPLGGYGCPKCAGNIKKTHDKYLSEVTELHGEDVKVIGGYDGLATKIKHECGFCGHTWFVTPRNILGGRRCPECFGHNKPTDEEYKQQVEDVHNGSIEVLDQYINARTKIEHYCLDCGNTWLARPETIKKGQGCPNCVDRWEGRRITTEDYKSRVHDIHDGDIEVIEGYEDSQTCIKHKCNLCGCVWAQKPSHILQGHGCPHCNISNGEQKIEDILEKYDINFDTQVKFDSCRDKKKLPFDFAIYDNNNDLLSLIEFDGKLHYQRHKYFDKSQSFKKRIEHDHIKDQYALSNNIPLLRLNYMDRDNNNIQPKLKSFLNNLGTVYA